MQLYSVKRSDVTGNLFEWLHLVKIMLYKSPPSILHFIRLLGENTAGQDY